MTDYSELEPSKPKLVVELERILDALKVMNVGDARELIKDLIWEYRDNFGLENAE